MKEGEKEAKGEKEKENGKEKSIGEGKETKVIWEKGRKERI